MTVESFAVLFSALGIVLGHVHCTGDPASRPGMVLYCTAGFCKFQLDRRRVGPLPFPIYSIIYVHIYVSMYNTVLCIQEKVHGHTAQCTPLYTVHTAVDDVTESTLF